MRRVPRQKPPASAVSRALPLSQPEALVQRNTLLPAPPEASRVAVPWRRLPWSGRRDPRPGWGGRRVVSAPERSKRSRRDGRGRAPCARPLWAILTPWRSRRPPSPCRNRATLSRRRVCAERRSRPVDASTRSTYASNTARSVGPSRWHRTREIANVDGPGWLGEVFESARRLLRLREGRNPRSESAP